MYISIRSVPKPPIKTRKRFVATVIILRCTLTRIKRMKEKNSNKIGELRKHNPKPHGRKLRSKETRIFFQVWVEKEPLKEMRNRKEGNNDNC